MSNIRNPLPIKSRPRYSAGHTPVVFTVVDLDAGMPVHINGKCGWATRAAARNALSHLLGRDHDRERFRVSPVVPFADAPETS